MLGLRSNPFVVVAAAVLITCTGCGEEEATDQPSPVVSAGEAYTVVFGPVMVPAGMERTQCVTKRLGNDGKLNVGSIHNELLGVSHHLIVYRVNDSIERAQPYDCESFTDATDPSKGSTLMITQKKDEVLTLPKGTAIVLEPNQMVRLEMHYINPSTQPSTVEAHATFHKLPDAEFEHEVGFLFAGGTDIDLAPGESGTLTAFITPPAELADKQFFAFTGHAHKLGTNVRVSMGIRGAGDMQPVYDVPDFQWSEAETVYHMPPKVLPQGAGFQVTCDWQNTSEKRVQYGVSAEDEMCFFWTYYYPTSGAKVCFTGQDTQGATVCCPDSRFCE